AGDRNDDDDDHEHPVPCDEEQIGRDRQRQDIGNSQRQRTRPPDEAAGVLQDEAEAERQQQAVDMVAGIDMPDQQLLDDVAEDRGQEGRYQQRAPEAEIGREREGEIAADGEEVAVREIHHVAEIDNQREAKRHKHVKSTNDQPVGEVEQDE